MTKGVITKYDGTHTVGTDINIFHYRGHHLLPGRHIGALIPRLHLDIEFGESSILGPVTTLYGMKAQHLASADNICRL